MPKRLESHKMGDLGESQVSQLFIANGHSASKIPSDYGEDIYIQPVLGQIVDPFRILLQVKSTSKLKAHKLSNGKFGIRIPVDLVMKWLRSDCLVVLVLWDIKNKDGYWCLPKDQASEYSLYVNKHKSIKYLFEPHNRLTNDGVEHLIWNARLNNFNRLYLEHQSVLNYPGIIDRDTEKIHAQRAVTLFDCLRCLQIIQNKGISSEYIKMYTKAKVSLARLDRKASKKDIREEAIILSLLSWVYRYTSKNGMPIPLLDGLSETISILIDKPEFYAKDKKSC